MPTYGSQNIPWDGFNPINVNHGILGDTEGIFHGGVVDGGFNSDFDVSDSGWFQDWQNRHVRPHAASDIVMNRKFAARQAAAKRAKSKKSFKSYNSWRGKDGKIHYRNEGQAGASAMTPASTAGFLDDSSTDLAGSVGPNISPFGRPNLSRVNSVVDSIIADATKQYRQQNDDIRYNLNRDLGSVAGAAMAYDRGAGALAAGNDMMRARQLGSSLAHKGVSDAMSKAAQKEAMQAAQTTGVPLDYAIEDAAANSDYELERANINSGARGFDDMLSFSRMSNAEDAQRLMAGSKAEARKAIADNNRALAEIRAQRARVGLDTEKQLWDMHIAQKLAEAEYAGRGEQVANAQYDRFAGDRTARMQGAELNAKINGTPAQRQEQMQKNLERAWTAIYGTTEKIKGDPQRIQTGTNQQGLPIYSVWTGEKYIQANPAKDYNDAVSRLRVAGLNGPRWERLARQIMAQVARDRGQEVASATWQSMNPSSWLGGWADGLSDMKSL